MGFGEPKQLGLCAFCPFGVCVCREMNKVMDLTKPTAKIDLLGDVEMSVNITLTESELKSLISKALKLKGYAVKPEEVEFKVFAGQRDDYSVSAFVSIKEK